MNEEMYPAQSEPEPSTGGVFGVYDLGKIQRIIDIECNSAFRSGEIKPQQFANARQRLLWNIRDSLEKLGYYRASMPVLTADNPPDQGCKIPPAGWYCSRAPGHDGPCAARRKHRSPEALDGEISRLAASLAPVVLVVLDEVPHAEFVPHEPKVGLTIEPSDDEERST